MSLPVVGAFEGSWGAGDFQCCCRVGRSGGIEAGSGLPDRFEHPECNEVAQIAYDVNRRTQNIGARRLYTILEKVFEQISFDAPDAAEKRVTVDAAYVRERLGEVLKDEDLSRFIL